MLQLFDTAVGRVVPLRTRDEGKVSMYVCGPTVYGPPHLGHGRFALVFDVLRRYLEWSGLDVTYVSNVTDIDDKIIDRAQAEGTTHIDVAHHWEAEWWEVMDAIGVKRPTHAPHATDYVAPMVDLISRLIDGGSAYETADGVYFRPAKVADYGLLARQDLGSLQAGARVDVADAKESPVDFVLWKKAKPGEPTWPSPWGDGRPGWHTECVVMALDLLGEGFDLHGGGQDLRFPHHENERAQAVADGRAFATHWAHNGFVEVTGEKMSKSLGNFTILRDLLDAHDARAYRLLVLQAHYRSPVEIVPDTLARADSSLERLDAFARRVADLPPASPDVPTIAAFTERMDDDLDAPGGMAVLFTALRRANEALDAGDLALAAPLAAAVHSMAKAVGLDLRAEMAAIPADVAQLASDRDVARAARDWSRADELRDRLQAEGWVVEDTPAGTVVRRP